MPAPKELRSAPGEEVGVLRMKKGGQGQRSQGNAGTGEQEERSHGREMRGKRRAEWRAEASTMAVAMTMMMQTT